MRTREEVEKIMSATYEADPTGSDPDMDLIRDVLRWVTLEDKQSAEDWLSYQGISDLVEENRN